MIKQPKMGAKTYRKTAFKETGDVYALLDLLTRLGWKVWRNNTGDMVKSYTNKDGVTKNYRVQFGVKGMPDIAGYMPWRRLSIGGWPEQRDFIDKAANDGCFAVLGTFDDVMKKLKEEGYL